MNIFDLFKRRPWDISALPTPWSADRRSVYETLRQGAVASDTEDDKDQSGDIELRWAPGASDGVFVHHTAHDDANGWDAIRALTRLLAVGSEANLHSFYRMATENRTLSYVDALLDEISAEPFDRPERLHAVALWLATQSPDPEPVKLGLSLLGLFGEDTDREVMNTLGRDDEFTLFAVTALSNRFENWEEDAFGLAQEVTGWGRIFAIERLAGTQNPEVIDWLLIDGYRNSVMHEYTAWICAVTGDLKTRLAAEPVDPRVFTTAGDIITCLLVGGASPDDIYCYEDGAAVLERYLELVGTCPLGEPAGALDHMKTVGFIESFVQDEEQSWELLQDFGWTEELRDRLATEARRLLDGPHWVELVEAGLACEITKQNHLFFWNAAGQAHRVGIDPWEAIFERTKEGENFWGWLMQTGDEDRVRRTVELAREKIDLVAIASGPSDGLGLGPKFEQHDQLHLVLQYLDSWPGLGLELILTALRSPVVRNRHRAVTALEAWPVLPREAVDVLIAAHAAEPEDDLREHMAHLLGPQS